MNISNGIVSLSSGNYNALGSAVGNGASSLVNIVLSFLPYMLMITVIFIVVRLLFNVGKLKNSSDFMGEKRNNVSMGSDGSLSYKKNKKFKG